MRIKSVIELLGFVMLPLGVGMAGSIVTAPAITNWYNNLNKPMFAPPNWLFGPVWTGLYVLMGWAAFLVWRKKGRTRKVALRLYWMQLGLNWLWSMFFFGLRSPLLAFWEIIILWVMIWLTIRKFWDINRIAGLMLFPYWMWVGFAAVLNGLIWWLN